MLFRRFMFITYQNIKISSNVINVKAMFQRGSFFFLLMACTISALFEGIVLVIEWGFWGLVWWVVLDSFLYFSLTMASLFKWVTVVLLGDVLSCTCCCNVLWWVAWSCVLTCLYKP